MLLQSALSLMKEVRWLETRVPCSCRSVRQVGWCSSGSACRCRRCCCCCRRCCCWCRHAERPSIRRFRSTSNLAQSRHQPSDPRHSVGADFRCPDDAPWPDTKQDKKNLINVYFSTDADTIDDYNCNDINIYVTCFNEIETRNNTECCSMEPS